MGAGKWTRRRVLEQALKTGVVTIATGLAGCARYLGAQAGGSGGAGSRATGPQLLRAPTSVGQGQTWEAALSVAPGVGNPFDPAEVEVACALHGPSGRSVTIPAFYYQGYTRSQSAGGAQGLQAAGAPEWRVRFAPPETGLWRYGLTYRRQNGSPVSLTAGHLRVTASEGPGYIGIDAAAPHAFMDRRTRQPYLPVGENVCWPDQGGTYDYDRWLGKLGAAGGNYIRLWVNEGRFTLGFEQSAPVGNYLGGMDHAWELDYVLDECGRLGMRAVICLLWHGAFSTTVNPDWANNPYNAANGGPCATPMDFFTDPTAQALFQRRLRYLVSRWSASTSVLAWELWNDVNWVEGYAGGPVEAWHRTMSAYLKQIDPNAHLVTTSYNNTTGDPVVWSLPTIDYVQMHDYNFPTVAEPISRLIAGARRSYDKPVVFGEFGIAWQSGADEVKLDPHGYSLHDALWGAVFAGGAGTGMTWWWDSYVDPLGLYSVFTGLTRVIAAEGLAAIRPAQDFAVQGFLAEGQTGVWGLQDAQSSRLVLWIKDLSVSWQTASAAPAVERLVTVTWFAARTARVRWLDTVTGKPVGATTATPGAAGLLLTVPTFTRDIAAVVEVA